MLVSVFSIFAKIGYHLHFSCVDLFLNFVFFEFLLLQIASFTFSNHLLHCNKYPWTYQRTSLLCMIYDPVLIAPLKVIIFANFLALHFVYTRMPFCIHLNVGIILNSINVSLTIYRNESKLIVWALQLLIIFCQLLTKYGCRPIFTNLG